MVEVKCGTWSCAERFVMSQRKDHHSPDHVDHSAPSPEQLQDDVPLETKRVSSDSLPRRNCNALPKSIRDLLDLSEQPALPSAPAFGRVSEDNSQDSMEDPDLQLAESCSPYANMTQASLHIWNTMFQVSDRALTNLFLLLRHPNFRLEDVPLNASQLHKLDSLLPLTEIGNLLFFYLC